MSSVPRLNCIGLSDPITSPIFFPLSPTRSPLSAKPETHHSPGTPTFQPFIAAERTTIDETGAISDREPFLNGVRPAKKPFYRPRPLWYALLLGSPPVIHCPI